MIPITHDSISNTVGKVLTERHLREAFGLDIKIHIRDTWMYKEGWLLQLKRNKWRIVQKDNK